jgi:hypothetical protein
MLRKTKKLYAVIALALAAVLLSATAAVAAVTFNPETGEGFVGKGDVQTAFGWNNKQLQTNASGVTFSYNATETFDAVCTWVTGEGTRGEKTHNVTKERSATVNSSIAYDPRVKNQITGFNLTGLGTTTGDPAPMVGDACSGGPNGGNLTSVELVSSSGGLYANYGDTSVLIWPPAAPVV